MHGDFIVEDVKQYAIVTDAQSIPVAPAQGLDIALGRFLRQLFQRFYYTPFLRFVQPLQVFGSLWRDYHIHIALSPSPLVSYFVEALIVL